MNEETANEFLCFNRHLQRVLFLFLAVVFPLESHRAIAGLQDALV